MRRKKIFAIGVTLILTTALPWHTALADTGDQAAPPALEAPSSEEAGPGEILPEGTVPGETLPVETISEEALPVEMPPQEPASAAAEEAGQAAGVESFQGGTISRGKNLGEDYSQVGPGMGSSTPQEPGQPDFTLNTVENPVVKVVEKYSYEQMEADIQSLEKRYGTAHMQVNTIGNSADGRKIYDIIIGNPNAGKHILIQGAIHAREYMNPLLMMKQIEDGLAFYDTGYYNGRKLSDLLNQVAVHFVPMTNPDGVALSQFGLDAIHSAQLKETIQNAYASDLAAGRTTLEFGRYLERWKANARGVDLNHNFDALWFNTSSVWMLPSFSGYKGMTPVSEPESQALVNLMNNGRPWAAVLNYHSMGKVIYWDIEGNKEKAKSQHLAQIMSTATGGYQMLYSGGGGGFKDWVQLRDGAVPSITVETGKAECPMPMSEFDSVWAENRAGWALVADFVLMY